MAIYTVHVPENVPDLVTGADRMVFLRDGFSLRAFLFGWLYLLWHRVWIASVVWVVLFAGFVLLWLSLHPPLFLFVALVGLMHLYLGAEGPDLVRWSLGRRGYPMQDLVSAASLDEAEAIFFGRQTARTTAPVRPLPRTAVPMPATPDVIGFSEAAAP